MKDKLVFTFLGGDSRTHWAKEYLASQGCRVEDEWTVDASCVVLPLPAFDGGIIRGGPPLEAVLPRLRPGVSIFGGQLTPNLARLRGTGAEVIDYYQDEEFTAANAAVTAEGALSLMMKELPCCIAGSKILVIGWGRIGKLLAKKLKALGAEVTVAARKDKDLAMAKALGFNAVQTGSYSDLGTFRVICNTVPAAVFPKEAVEKCAKDVLLLELASSPGGIYASGGRTLIRAGGLPGKYAPETAGKILGQTILRLAERSKP